MNLKLFRCFFSLFSVIIFVIFFTPQFIFADTVVTEAQINQAINWANQYHSGYGGECGKYVHAAFNYGAGIYFPGANCAYGSGFPGCKTSMLMNMKPLKFVDYSTIKNNFSSVPRGALIFYGSNNDAINCYGHVGIYDGNGNICDATWLDYSNKIERSGCQPIYKEISSNYCFDGNNNPVSGKNVIKGWSFYNGYTLYSEKGYGTLDVNGILDGINWGSTSMNDTSYGTFDVYINDELVANDWGDYYNSTLEEGTRYKITDIRAADGFVYKGYEGAELSGTISANTTTDVRLKFNSNSAILNVNGILDGEEADGIGGWGTFDVFINHEYFDEWQVTDYYKRLEDGSEYEIMNIKANEGFAYKGTDDALRGIITAGNNVTIKLKFDSCYLNVDGWLDGVPSDNIGQYGTFTMYLNGQNHYNQTDFWQQVREGSSYNIYDIHANEGYIFKGIRSGAQSGSVNGGRTTIVLEFETIGGPGKSKEDAVSWAEAGITGDDNIKGTRNGYDYTDNEITLSYLPFDAYGLQRITSATDFVASGIIEILNSEDAGSTNMAEGWNKAPRGAVLVWKRYLEAYGKEVSFIGLARGDGTMVTAMTDYGVTDARIWFFNNRQTQNQGFIYQGYGFFKGYTLNNGTIILLGALDVNGLLDGINSGNTDGYGTFDVYLDGKLVADDQGDYSKELNEGTAYEIKDIKALDGYTYNGTVAGTLSGTISAGITTDVRLKFDTNPQIDPYDNNDFVIDENDVLIQYNGGNKYSSVTIPNGVTAIGDGVFRNNIWVNDVTIPDGVTSIGNYAFAGCSNLMSIDIPDSVTYIGEGAFSGCINITDIHIPEGITSIEDHTFDGCISLYGLTIPDSVTSIGNYAFAGCRANLTEILIPDSVTFLGDYAFSGCENLTHVIIPNKLKSMGNNSFSGCSGLTDVIISDSVTAIGDYAFSDCWRLNNVIIPNSVNSIGKYAFSNCSGLTDLTISDKLESIGQYAFQGCTSLENVTIPDSVSSIEKGAFSGSGLTSITIPNSVESISHYAFYECINLKRITIPNSVSYMGQYSIPNSTSDHSPNWYSVTDKKWYTPDQIRNRVGIADTYLANLDMPEPTPSDFVIDENHVLIQYNGTISDVVIPSGVTGIADNVFENNNSVFNVTIPHGVVSIGNNAFSGCINLTNITIPDSVLSVGVNAFQGCTSLYKITIPGSIKDIPSYAFLGCTGLVSVDIYTGVETIGIGAFRGCTGLTSLAIPASIKTIGEQAFVSCTSLNNIKIPYGVEKLDYGAFSGCTGLTNISLPNSVTTIEGYVFAGCTSLEKAILPSNLTIIMHQLFQGCSSLSDIVIPDKVTSIRPFAFDGCKKLATIIIPDSVTSIEHHAFWNCSNLTFITFPASLTSIGEDAIPDSAFDNPPNWYSVRDQTWYTPAQVMSRTGIADTYLAKIAGNPTVTPTPVITPTAPVETKGKLTVSSEMAAQGREAVVKISLAENPGIVALTLGFNYDKTRLSYTGFEVAGLTGWTVTDGKMSWIGIANSTYNGEILKLKFKVLDTAPDGDAVISLTCGEGDMADTNENSYIPLLEPGKVTVMQYIPGDMNGDSKVNALDLVRL